LVTRVKICGITRPEDAALAVQLGASALGFNFYPNSPRYIPPERARDIIRAVPPPVMTVGVFADETSVDHVLTVARDSGVNTIQLHGPRFPAHWERSVKLTRNTVILSRSEAEARNLALWTETARDFSSPPAPRNDRLDGFFPYPLIRAVTVDDSFEPASLQSLEAGAFLLDAFHPTLKGGTGRTIDWSKAREATRYGRVILAGGLTPENVAEAIRQVRPFAVDVASGVETSPGVKDPSKLRAFFAAVHEADRNPLP
jgi:phosphoribosylanthranilate isomerase